MVRRTVSHMEFVSRQLLKPPIPFLVGAIKEGLEQVTAFRRSHGR